MVTPKTIRENNYVRVNFDEINQRLYENGETKASLSRELGFSESWYGGIENREVPIKKVYARGIAQFLGCDIDCIEIKEAKKIDSRKKPESIEECVDFTWKKLNWTSELVVAINLKQNHIIEQLNKLSKSLELEKGEQIYERNQSKN